MFPYLIGRLPVDDCASSVTEAESPRIFYQVVIQLSSNIYDKTSTSASFVNNKCQSTVQSGNNS
ncbi:hypothetical protein KIN20_033498 [Parelaphostrongylus tenuis]|uniref:Uncharacterized protein n=1 Tax=Parelaphostrongylus tenuis TaxID=148309 RepID=A0AAD5R876_PARTN|nr:hypothetical protein KIN20_033498 [Parelaphostrongylus tenuis]